MILSLFVLSVVMSPFSFRVHLSELSSMGLHRVRHDWSDLTVAAAYKAQRPRAFPDVGFLVLKPGQPLANQDPGHPSSVYRLPQSWLLPLVCPTPCLLSNIPHPLFLLAHHFCSPQGVIYSSHLGTLWERLRAEGESLLHTFNESSFYSYKLFKDAQLIFWLWSFLYQGPWDIWFYHSLFLLNDLCTLCIW